MVFCQYRQVIAVSQDGTAKPPVEHPEDAIIEQMYILRGAFALTNEIGFATDDP
jgi:hypothetical protein